ncbi:MAG: acyltransferase [Verrucomicrobia bacterium]|nr:acyltransferase [Verrucomicrobiota bacterium]
MDRNNDVDKSSAPNGSRRIAGLDGLRGIAVLFVLMEHGAYSLFRLDWPPAPFLGNGALGVSIFFGLSGYLIYELSAREFEKTGAFNWKAFYLRRILRIFPCFYSYLAVVLILTGLGLLNLTRPVLFSVATFSLNYRHIWDHTSELHNYYAIGHYWTLALEEQFYLTWPLLMFLFARRRLLPVMTAVILLAPFIRVFCYFFTPGSRAQIGMMFHTGFDSIAMGVLLGELLRRPEWKARLQTLARNPWVLGGAIVFLVLISPALNLHFKGSYSITVGKTLELACIAIIITAAVFSLSPTLSAVLKWRPLTYIGVLSYSLYVWNPLFLNAETHWFINVFPLNFIGIFAAGACSYYLIERPVLRFKERLRRQPTRVDAGEPLPEKTARQGVAG